MSDRISLSKDRAVALLNAAGHAPITRLPKALAELRALDGTVRARLIYER